MARPTFPLFVVDIDLTIADPSHREGLLVPHCTECELPPEQMVGCKACVAPTMKVPQHCWDEFICAEAVALDPPIPEAQRVLNYLFSQGAKVRFVTGRNEGLREVTEQWLIANFDIPDNSPKVYMRTMDQMHVPASVYKRGVMELLLELFPNPWPIVFFEDDPFVQRMYAECGLVFQGPECWASMCPPGEPASDEEAWRK